MSKILSNFALKINAVSLSLDEPDTHFITESRAMGCSLCVGGFVVFPLGECPICPSRHGTPTTLYLIIMAANSR